MDSVYVQAATFQVRPEFGGHVHLGSIMRAFMGQWTRHTEALKERWNFKGGRAKRSYLFLRLLSLVIRHPWWQLAQDCLTTWYYRWYKLE